MKKGKLYTLILGFCLILLLLAACAAPAPAPAPGPPPGPAPPAKPIELKFANFFPPVAKMSILGEDFIAEIDKRTNGRVKITIYAGGALGAPSHSCQVQSISPLSRAVYISGGGIDAVASPSAANVAASTGDGEAVFRPFRSSRVFTSFVEKQLKRPVGPT